MIDVNKTDFERCLGQTFQILFDNQPTDAELIEVSGIRADTNKGGRQEPFTLVFRTVAKEAYIQGTYLVANNKLGETAIFLVPIGPDDTGMRYEAIFT